MDDTEQRDRLDQEKLTKARAMLTPEQRDRLDRMCDLRLREEGFYAAKHEIALAGVIYEDRAYVHQKSDIETIVNRAKWEANDREIKQQYEAKARPYKEAERQHGQLDQPTSLNTVSVSAEASQARVPGEQNPWMPEWQARAIMDRGLRGQRGRYDVLKSQPPNESRPNDGGSTHDGSPVEPNGNPFPHGPTNSSSQTGHSETVAMTDAVAGADAVHGKGEDEPDLMGSFVMEKTKLEVEAMQVARELTKNQGLSDGHYYFCVLY